MIYWIKKGSPDGGRKHQLLFCYKQEAPDGAILHEVAFIINHTFVLMIIYGTKNRLPIRIFISLQGELKQKTF